MIQEILGSARGLDGEANFWLGDIPSGNDYDFELYDYAGDFVRGSYSTARQEQNEVQERYSEDIKSWEPEANKILRYVDIVYGMNPIPGREYLVFVKYYEKAGYFVCSDAYGMREINDQGLVYNPDTKNYETLHMLE